MRHGGPLGRVGRPGGGYSDHLLELGATVVESDEESGVVERGERVVADSVEADLEPLLRQVRDIGTRKSRVCGIDVPPEPVDEAGAAFRRKVFDGTAETADRPRKPAFRPRHQLFVDIRKEGGGEDAGIARGLEELPPVASIRRRTATAKEERCRQVNVAQDRRRMCSMAEEIVVEGNGNGNAVAAPPERHCIDQFRCGRSFVPAAEMSELTPEGCDCNRRNEFLLGSPSSAASRW